MTDETVKLVPIESFAKKLEADRAQAQPASKGRWNLRARDCLQKVCVVYLILKNPGSPFPAKVVAALSVGYIFSPIQLIPSFIPVIGWMDDIVVVSVGMRLLTKLTPPAILAQCAEHARILVAKLLREEAVTLEQPAPDDHAADDH
jgi:uncharacterized membrane protein YkvA (DUF1232 family)